VLRDTTSLTKMKSYASAQFRHSPMGPLAGRLAVGSDRWVKITAILRKCHRRVKAWLHEPIRFAGAR
jgi:hypothetical protein